MIKEELLFTIEDEFQLFAEWNAPRVMDPFSVEEQEMEKVDLDFYEGDKVFEMPPNSMAKGKSVEAFFVCDDEIALVRCSEEYSSLGLLLSDVVVVNNAHSCLDLTLLNPTCSAIRIYPHVVFGKLIKIKNYRPVLDAGGLF